VFSAFAGNPLLISVEKLVEDGFVLAEDLKRPPIFSVDHVDYRRVIEQKRIIFGKAYKRFQTDAPAEPRQAFQLFREQHASWLEGFSLLWR